jgi:hypothetical protein
VLDRDLSLDRDLDLSRDRDRDLDLSLDRDLGRRPDAVLGDRAQSSELHAKGRDLCAEARARVTDSKPTVYARLSKAARHHPELNCRCHRLIRKS